MRAEKAVESQVFVLCYSRTAVAEVVAPLEASKLIYDNNTYLVVPVRPLGWGRLDGCLAVPQSAKEQRWWRSTIGLPTSISYYLGRIPIISSSGGTLDLRVVLATLSTIVHSLLQYCFCSGPS
jgi:hypothetical protein